MIEISKTTSVEAFILAGGRSRRLGSDKALAVWQGRPLLAWALQALEETGLAPTVVSPEVEAYRSLASRFLTRERPGLGPVEGLRVVLLAAQAPWALVLSVDMPCVDSGTLRSLLAFDRTGEQVVCFADSSGRRHPFPGLYNRTLLRSIEEQGPGGSMQHLLDVASPRLLRASELAVAYDLDSVLRNVNCREDLD